MKFISKFNHSFTKSGCLHSAIPKALNNFKEKRARKPRDLQFFPSKWGFQDFENV